MNDKEYTGSDECLSSYFIDIWKWKFLYPESYCIAELQKT